jgi:hypothetical protein
MYLDNPPHLQSATLPVLKCSNSGLPGNPLFYCLDHLTLTSILDITSLLALLKNTNSAVLQSLSVDIDRIDTISHLAEVSALLSSLPAGATLEHISYQWSPSNSFYDTINALLVLSDSLLDMPLLWVFVPHFSGFIDKLEDWDRFLQLIQISLLSQKVCLIDLEDSNIFSTSDIPLMLQVTLCLYEHLLDKRQPPTSPGIKTLSIT